MEYSSSVVNVFWITIVLESSASKRDIIVSLHVFIVFFFRVMFNHRYIFIVVIKMHEP